MQKEKKEKMSEISGVTNDKRNSYPRPFFLRDFGSGNMAARNRKKHQLNGISVVRPRKEPLIA